ncbi:autotransporter domain-containing protein [Ciceribacter sp. L1K23]|uniref:putative Ig domain-containing protein n=1 Tax=Ciceribacter sp. L1K23 TaxID=2820276 RepID=UPI001B81A94B|nr:putative Ig domain-containing protein [Ciceribacter sp. L1K23]MBR0555667.1 autotransporter domain-containing protein [Ciceribacter sp. L1K23]
MFISITSHFRRFSCLALAALAFLVCLSQTSARATDYYYDAFSGEAIRITVNSYGQNSIGYDYPNGIHGRTDATLDTTVDLIFISDAGYLGMQVITTTAYEGMSSNVVARDTHYISVKPRITFSASTWPHAKKGESYSQSVTATFSAGSGDITYSIEDGSLPSGLTLNASTGEISGTPSESGSSSFSFKATNADGYSSFQSMTLKVGPSARNYSSPISANSLTVSMLFGLSDSESISGVSAASHGTTGFSQYAVTYRPNAGYSGPDSFTFTVTESESGLSDTATITITVAPPTLAISPTTLPDGTTTIAYEETLSAANGTAPYSYAVTSGALPSGLSLSPAGVLSGTPTTAESRTFTVTATDVYGATGNRVYSVNVVLAAPVAGNVNATVEANSNGNAITTAVSGGIATSVAIASSPAHGAASASGTSITYTPTSGYSGTDSFTYTATNASGTSAAATVTVTVAAPTLAIAPSTLVGGTADVAYDQTLSASAGTAPYRFEVTSGALPDGLTLSGDGTLSGVPVAEESAAFTVTATDAYGATGSRSYTITTGIALPVAGAVNATVAANSSENGIALTLSGGAASSVAIASDPSHGTASASGTSITYTPTAGYSGSDSFTYTATNASGTSASATVTVTVSAPTLAVAPSSLPAATGGVAYDATVTAAEGTAPYTFEITAGDLPDGLTLASDGTISGTPAGDESASFTITATDAYGATGSRSYTLGVAVAAPVAGDVSASVAANSSANAIPVNLSGGAAASVAIASAPSHGTATVSGTAISYTPAAGYSGAESFTYTASNATGTSAAATVTVMVGAPDIAVTPTGRLTLRQAEAFSQAFTAANGTAPYSFAVSGTLPEGLSFDTATATLSGTPAVDGEFALAITATDALGASSSAAVTLVIDPALPVAPSKTSAVVSGLTTIIDLTEGATGGPFTDAKLLSLSPPESGTAVITLGDTAATDGNAAIAAAQAAGRYQLRFTANPMFSGTATITYTLTGATGTSAPAAISLMIAARPVLNEDADLIGLIEAQASAAKRLADGQIDNVTDHLRSLRGKACLENSASLSLSDGADGSAPVTANAGCSPIAGGDLAFWANGSIALGDGDNIAGASAFDYATVALTAGVDYRFDETFIGGLAVGVSRDRTDIGTDGTTSLNRAASATVYGLYQPGGGFFVDGLVGAGLLDFNSVRVTSATGSEAEADRGGWQVYGAITGGYDHQIGGLSMSTYARLGASRSFLDSVEETGAGWENAAIGSQTADSLTATLGVTFGYDILLEDGVLTPELELDFSHDFLGTSDTTVTYADGWPIDYVVPGSEDRRNSASVGFGLTFASGSGGTLSGRYKATFDGDGLKGQRFNIDFTRQF